MVYRISYSLLMMATLALLSACTTPAATVTSQPAVVTETASPYAPGLGEFMAQISTRHLKLWFAGQAKNWPLAAYELDEIHEGLEDLAKYHPTHDKVKGAVPTMIDSYMKTALAQTETAIKAQDSKAFRAGYDSLTQGCNACHQANDFGFNVIQLPNHNPFSNQAFGSRR
jgi:hypothetical protein